MDPPPGGPDIVGTIARTYRMLRSEDAVPWCRAASSREDVESGREGLGGGPG
jgi:hypothetical protein